MAAPCSDVAHAFFELFQTFTKLGYHADSCIGFHMEIDME